MGPEMHNAGRSTPPQKELIARFFTAFEFLRRPVRDHNDTLVPLNQDHLRSMVQLCLQLALLTPGTSLTDELVVDDQLTVRDLDDRAVEAMSAWLATPIDKNDANVIGSASKPSFIASVEACRRDAGPAAGYVAWRRRWPRLDRYRDQPGRAERLRRIFDSIPGD